MKIFFDTNVYVAEALLGQVAQQLVDTTITAGWRIFVNAHVLDECERVLAENLGSSRRFALLTRRRIARRATLVSYEPGQHVVPADADDSPILRGAIAGGVHLLVTNDHHLLELNPYESVQIVTMADYRQLLVNEGLLS
jgi:predicted nucleic acid-binding protein